MWVIERLNQSFLVGRWGGFFVPFSKKVMYTMNSLDVVWMSFGNWVLHCLVPPFAGNLILGLLNLRKVCHQSCFFLLCFFLLEKNKATPLKFNSSSLKQDGWKTILSFWDDNFSGENSQEKTSGGPIFLWAWSSKLPSPFTLQQSDGNPPNTPEIPWHISPMLDRHSLPEPRRYTKKISS